ncbi:uncharacterized protein LOC127870745 isoform X2 [Dreissena polymorpha]|nr:uncharacterized protein LOC127870745 isoform X2 [Dreissena polymorpha]XP_052269149.1 uncharacterized protein LOC127870745 isoform X2 [Dreissena polymorpha]XP_052269150.1 uncharacterized protein LOC127870745 isoform X2 [Dreissena polymorpha]XP_052269151.1 uncharacterized protein LOC127870745 isoform X2 [Dreissena polymorpha]XP_052269152.1 uncharacterized protein LOC127870745 isoform X2 [Dreissena polymorpha]
MSMADYKDILRKPETQNWLKVAICLNSTRDCLLVIAKGIALAYYDDIRKAIKQNNGIPENAVCSQCNTPNVVAFAPKNKCCNRGKCHFHDIHKPRNCPINNLCHEIRRHILKQHRFSKPTWINTDASKWCTDPWHIAKCYLPKDGYSDVNQAEDTDFNGIVNVIYNCIFYQTYFNDDLTHKKNVCTKARDVGRKFRHAPTLSMTSRDSDTAIDTLVSLLKSIKHADHQAASLTTVDKLTQLKNGTISITDQDIATTFEHYKDTSPTVETRHWTLTSCCFLRFYCCLTGEDYKALVINEVTAVDILPERKSTLTKVQEWLIQHYKDTCVTPVSMLDADIDGDLSRIYVPPSIEELRRGQRDMNVWSDALCTTKVGTYLSSYKELLHRDGKEVNTIYIQGDTGCGKTTFCKKLALDWCKAHSKTTSNVNTSETAPTETTFGDIDTLRDYTFLFFVSLSEFSEATCNISQMVEDEVEVDKA